MSCDDPSDSRDGGRIVPLTPTCTAALSLSLHLPRRAVVFINLKPFVALSWFFSMQSFLHSARTGHPRNLSSFQHTSSCSPAELPSQIVMSVPLGKEPPRICSCGCNRSLCRSTEWRHIKKKTLTMRHESPPPPKRRRVACSQAGQESFIITPDKQKQSRTDNISSSSHTRADASDRPQISNPRLHAPSTDEFNPSLPLLDPPPASNLPQPPGDTLTEASDLYVDNVLLNLYTRTHRTTDQSDDEDSEGAPEGDAVEAVDYVDHETDDSWNGEDIAVEGDADPREGIVSDWDLLAEEFIVEAEELSKFEHSLLRTS